MADGGGFSARFRYATWDGGSGETREGVAGAREVVLVGEGSAVDTEDDKGRIDSFQASEFQGQRIGGVRD